MLKDRSEETEKNKKNVKSWNTTKYIHARPFYNSNKLVYKLI